MYKYFQNSKFKNSHKYYLKLECNTYSFYKKKKKESFVM